MSARFRPNGAHLNSQADEATCDAFPLRFAGLTGVPVVRGRFEDRPPHDRFVFFAYGWGEVSEMRFELRPPFVAPFVGLLIAIGLGQR